MIFRTLILISFATTLCSTCMANNSYFLPSDAFFFTRINGETAKMISDSDSHTFSYGSKANGGFGCGDLGYLNLRIDNISDEIGNALIDAHKSLAPLLDSRRMMNVFVYPVGYDWKKYGIGLQYNESWVGESLVFGAHPDHVRLGSFVTGRELVARNWRDSTRIPSLGANCPEIPAGHQQSWRNTPATVSAESIKFLIIPDRQFDAYLNHTDTKGKVIIEISAGEMTTFKYSNGKWRKP